MSETQDPLTTNTVNENLADFLLNEEETSALVELIEQGEINVKEEKEESSESESEEEEEEVPQKKRKREYKPRDYIRQGINTKALYSLDNYISKCLEKEYKFIENHKEKCNDVKLCFPVRIKLIDFWNNVRGLAHEHFAHELEQIAIHGKVVEADPKLFVEDEKKNE